MNHKADNAVEEGAEAEGFYSRWSKRKVQQCSSLQAENQAELSTGISPSLENTADTQTLSKSNEEKVLLCDKDMPDLDSLDEDSDYSGFLSPGVSEKLRKMALRKLFQGRGFNLCDGLDDYDEEFTSFEKLGDIVTADMRFQLQEEAKRKLQAAAQEDDIPDEDNTMAMLDEACPENEVKEPLPAAWVDETAAVDEEIRESIEQQALSNNEKCNNEKLS